MLETLSGKNVHCALHHLFVRQEVQLSVCVAQVILENDAKVALLLASHLVLPGVDRSDMSVGQIVLNRI